jgi:hypothetical protein
LSCPRMLPPRFRLVWLNGTEVDIRVDKGQASRGQSREDACLAVFGCLTMKLGGQCGAILPVPLD